MSNESSVGIIGDSFGTVNALFSGLAFLGIIVSLWYQRRDLSYQRDTLEVQQDELKQNTKELRQHTTAFIHQRFDNTFFNMVTLHNEIIGTVSCGSFVGRDALGRIALHYEKQFKISLNKNLDAGMESVIKHARELHYAEYGNKFGHYIRNLHSILKFVHQQSVSMDQKERQQYTDIVRAQLSSGELRLFLFEALSQPLLKDLIETYGLLYEQSAQERLIIIRDNDVNKDALILQRQYLPSAWFENGSD